MSADVQAGILEVYDRDPGSSPGLAHTTHKPIGLGARCSRFVYRILYVACRISQEIPAKGGAASGGTLNDILYATYDIRISLDKVC